MKLNSKYGDVFFKNCIQRSLSIFLSLLMSTYAFAQTNFKTDSTGIVADTLTNDTIFQFVEEMPEFPGGEVAFTRFLRENLRTPSDGNEEYPPKTIYVSYVVEKDGSVSNVSKMRGSSDQPQFENEIIRVMNLLPNYSPGKKNGKPVRVRLVCPIRFQS